MNVSTLTRGRIAGLFALASPVLGVSLAFSPRGPQERPVRFPFVTIDTGLYSGFGDHCAAVAYPDGAAAEVARLAAARMGGGDPPSGPCYAPVATPAFEGIFRNECAWLDFWREHAFDDPTQPPPFIDFGRDVVVAVIQGPSSGCHEIEIEGIASAPGGGRRIHVRQEIPCNRISCTVLSNTYHFVQVPAEFLPPGAPVAFVHDEPAPDGLLHKARRP
jgi:hypothetical protein